MNLRFWLKQNFLRRGFRWLSERAQEKLFSNIRLPSLFARLPWPHRRRQTLPRNGRRLDVVSDENIDPSRDYVSWIAPLNSLPNNVTIEQLREAVQALPNYDPAGRRLFPSDSYLEANQSHQHLAVEFVHRCRVQRAGAVFENNAILSPLASAPEEPEVMLIYDRPFESQNSYQSQKKM